MKKKYNQQRKNELLRCICSLPNKMTKIHGTENMTEFLLQHLARPHCFNLSKAAYFVDNPDFDLLKGLAGFHHKETFHHPEHWNTQDEFTLHMKNSSFNRKVRSIGKRSHKKLGASEHTLISHLADELEFERPLHKILTIKHDNHSLFLFELADQEEREIVEEVLEDTLYLFGFCPIF